MLKKSKKFLIVALLCLPACKGMQEGYIHVDAVEGTMTRIMDRHDAMLNGTLDPATISEEQKTTDLRDTAIIRKVFEGIKEG